MPAPKTIYLALIETTQHYGGPEEGGWYYRWNDILWSLETTNPRRARRLVRRWNARQEPDNQYDEGICMWRTTDKEMRDMWQSKKRPYYE